MVPVAPIITGITFVFTFHMRCISIVRSLLLLLLLLFEIIYTRLPVGLRKTTRNWRGKRMSRPRFQPAHLEQKSQGKTLASTCCVVCDKVGSLELAQAETIGRILQMR